MTDPMIRIAEALERLAPAPAAAPDFSAEAFAWHTGPDRLEPVSRVSRVDIGLLIGVNRSRDTLLENTTTRFSGARGGWGNRRWSRRFMQRCAPKGMI
jgi:predicted AAA+ superfamily ATPase